MSLALLALGLALLGALTGHDLSRIRFLLGSLCLGLASASLHAVAGTDDPGAMSGAGLEGTALIFLQVVAGLVLLGVGLAWTAGWWIPVALFTGLTALSVRSLFLMTGWLRPIGFAAGLLAGAVLSWILIARLRPGRLLVAIDRGLLDPANRSAARPRPGWTPTAPVLAASGAALLALLVPHLWPVLGGSLIAVVAGWMVQRRAGKPAPMLLLAAVVLGATLLWSVRLSGPLGGWIPILIDGPFSPRAAQILALMVGIVGLILAAAWPVHAVSVPIVLAPVAVAVAGVFGTLLIPDGVQWWQPIFAPLALVGMLHAVAHRRVDQLLVVAGLYGLWTGTREGAVGGALLMGTGWLAAVAPSTWLGRLRPPVPLQRALWLIPAVGALAVIRGGIATETTYALLGATVAAGAIVLFAPRGKASPVAPAPQGEHI